MARKRDNMAHWGKSKKHKEWERKHRNTFSGGPDLRWNPETRAWEERRGDEWVPKPNARRDTADTLTRLTDEIQSRNSKRVKRVTVAEVDADPEML